jgi:hypothetical protein
MKICDMPRFAQLMKMLCDNYNRTLTEEVSDAYWRLLKKYTIIQIEGAVDKHMSNSSRCQFMPQVGDIISWIEGTDEIKALRAWSKVENAIRRIGRNDSVQFDDELIHSVIQDMGGWVAFCDAKMADLPFRAQEFRKRYCWLLVQPPETIEPYLCGLFEHTNRMLGYAAPEPRLIGETVVAPPVLLSHQTASATTWPQILCAIEQDH